MTFKDLLKSKCQDMVNHKARREALLHILGRKGQEVQDATGLKVTVAEGPSNTIWINIKGSWPHPHLDEAVVFKTDIRVEPTSDESRWLFHYNKERYENETAVFDVLAHDIACAMPSAEMQKVLGKGSH